MGEVNTARRPGYVASMQEESTSAEGIRARIGMKLGPIVAPRYPLEFARSPQRMFVDPDARRVRGIINHEFRIEAVLSIRRVDSVTALGHRALPALILIRRRGILVPGNRVPGLNDLPIVVELGHLASVECQRVKAGGIYGIDRIVPTICVAVQRLW